MRAPLLCLLVLLPGCVGPEDPRPQPEPASVDDAYLRCPCPGPDAPMAVDAPDLPVGRAWTYAGMALYNPDAEWTVIVAQASAEGYLFAGGAEDDVAYDALWNDEAYGARSRDLGKEGGLRTFAWPLQDGKTWELFDGFPVRARAAEIATPRGREPGFVIEGADDERHVRYEYAPSVGNLVRYESSRGGETSKGFELKAVADNVTGWVWYEPGPLVEVPDPTAPAAFDVPAGFDALLVSAGGAKGGRALVEPPGAAQPWTGEFAGAESWRHAVLPPSEGKWVASVQGKPWLDGAPGLPVDAPMGWAHVNLRPVKWVRGG